MRYSNSGARLGASLGSQVCQLERSSAGEAPTCVATTAGVCALTTRGPARSSTTTSRGGPSSWRPRLGRLSLRRSSSRLGATCCCASTFSRTCFRRSRRWTMSAATCLQWRSGPRHAGQLHADWKAPDSCRSMLDVVGRRGAAVHLAVGAPTPPRWRRRRCPGARSRGPSGRRSSRRCGRASARSCARWHAVVGVSGQRRRRLAGGRVLRARDLRERLLVAEPAPSSPASSRSSGSRGSPPVMSDPSIVTFSYSVRWMRSLRAAAPPIRHRQGVGSRRVPARREVPRKKPPMRARRIRSDQRIPARLPIGQDRSLLRGR
jgi:hypothetical protein